MTPLLNNIAPTPPKRFKSAHLIDHISIEHATPDIYILTYYCKNGFYMTQPIKSGEFLNRIIIDQNEKPDPWNNLDRVSRGIGNPLRRTDDVI